jgi:hypothetical protein
MKIFTKRALTYFFSLALLFAAFTIFTVNVARADSDYIEFTEGVFIYHLYNNSVNETGDNDNTAVLVNYTGLGGAVEVPETVSYLETDYTVTQIGYLNTSAYGEFKDSEITTITLPDTIEIIGLHAFDGCSNLESVTIPAAVT